MTGLASLIHWRHWIVASALLLGLLASGLAWNTVRRNEVERTDAAFRRRAEEQVRVVRERIRLYEEMTHGLHNLFAASEDVSRAEFERACANLLNRHPGIQALEWVPLVRNEQRAAFEADAANDYPGFVITERDAATGKMSPSRIQPEYTVIRLVTPLEGNEAALGYDNSHSLIGAALAKARRERRLIATHQFELAQARWADDEFGIVFALPVFESSPAPGTDGFRGFVQGVFRVETMLAEPHRARPDAALLIYYRDLNAGDARASLYVNLAGHEPRRTEADVALPPAGPDTEHFEETIPIGGRRWQFLVHMNPEWRARQLTSVPSLVLAGGMVTTSILVLFLNVLLRRTAEIERQVATRTAELERTKKDLEDDIERRREVELALESSEQRMQAILDNSPAAIFVKDLDGCYVLCNRRFAEVCRRSRAEIIGRTDSELFPPESALLFQENDRRVLASGRAAEFEEYIVNEGGRQTALVQKFLLKNPEGATYALCGIATDITERLEAEKARIDFERRLQQTQKLESLGVLAGGIAHDFNNILTTVLGNATLARHQLPDNSPVGPQLQQIEIAARRAADLCAQMLAYAGRGNLVPGRIDLSELVRDTAALLEVSVPKNSQLQLNLAGDLPAVHADATQLRQIVMNLVINAADAIGDRPGQIHLTTYVVEASPELLHRAVQHPELPGGRYAAIEVRDNGVGIPAEMLSRIFEPFFTTKFSGRGLGLSAVLGIVRSHRGAMFVESQPGAGSCFRLLLPVAEPAVLAAAAPAVTPPPEQAGGALPQLQGTVLLIDDETHVRDITELALRSCGLEVMAAATGEEGIRLCREHPEMIDLVLLDLTMPGLSGEETLRRLRMQGARQKVILMSGYSENDATRRCLQLGASAFVQKPFELTQLLALLKAHLR